MGSATTSAEVMAEREMWMHEKVDSVRGGAIKVGDLLVTSETEGVAMKSVPVELGGVSFHRPGTIVGKALEPLEEGTGEILVLLSLQ
jgi:hypothetical protein